MKSYVLTAAPLTAPVYRVEYDRALNADQLAAVTRLQGPMLCIAGAGSGKTRTLVYRVARLIESGVSPHSILLLTFTRKAAALMMRRAAELVGSAGELIAGGTYHSFAHLMLRQHGAVIGLESGFSIMDEADAGDVINLIRTELGLNSRETRFPQKKTLKQIHSRAANTGLTVQQVLEREYPHFLEIADGVIAVLDGYRCYKEKNLLLDYDDLLIFLERLLQQSALRETLTDRYRYLMVDEYQDTNVLQARITALLAGKHRNIMVVGDDAQSIYSFRGATVRNILEFKEVFPEAHVVTLRENYRSTKAILTASNQLMSQAGEGFKKELFTRLHDGEKPALVACSDEEEQSQFVAQRILELREEGIPLSRMSVLFRSGFHAFQLELELKRRNIPYVKWGGFKFLEAAHIKDLIAHLRVLRNPRDYISWQRVLLLVEGVGTRTIPKIFAQIQTMSDPFALDQLQIPPKMAPGVKILGETLGKAARSGRSPESIVSVLTDYYLPILKRQFDDFPRRTHDLDQMAIICSRYQTLDELLLDFALEPPANSVEGGMAADRDREDRLVLSTIHSAKGLEWHSVFVIWLLEGKFPSFAALGTPRELEEERRLMYVAMTRSERNLFLCFPVRAWDAVSREVLARPSRFIEEIGNDALDSWSLTRR
jgi:DNA helicase-2/ATP-dependent DNA helicase PcrA